MAKGWLTAKEMKNKYGARAKDVMKHKKAIPGQYKLDDDDNEPRWYCKVEDKNSKAVANIKSKGVEQQAADHLSPHVEPLAICNEPSQSGVENDADEDAESEVDKSESDDEAEDATAELIEKLGEDLLEKIASFGMAEMELLKKFIASREVRD